jgi:hypothetical protein
VHSTLAIRGGVTLITTLVRTAKGMIGQTVHPTPQLFPLHWEILKLGSTRECWRSLTSNIPGANGACSTFGRDRDSDQAHSIRQWGRGITRPLQADSRKRRGAGNREPAMSPSRQYLRAGGLLFANTTTASKRIPPRFAIQPAYPFTTSQSRQGQGALRQALETQIPRVTTHHSPITRATQQAHEAPNELALESQSMLIPGAYPRISPSSSTATRDDQGP